VEGRKAHDRQLHTVVAAQTTKNLVTACEHRLGLVVSASSPFELRRICSPAGSLKLCRPLSTVMALTDQDVRLLELRRSVLGVRLGRALGCCPRRGLVAHWAQSRWAWPHVWKAELSWPTQATYIEGSVVSGPDTDRLLGLLLSDELSRELGRPAAHRD
jgi:hypothetical protein